MPLDAADMGTLRTLDDIIRGDCTPPYTININAEALTDTTSDNECMDALGIVAGTMENHANIRPLVLVGPGGEMVRELLVWLEWAHTAAITVSTACKIGLLGLMPSAGSGFTAGNLIHSDVSAFPTETTSTLWLPLTDVDGNTNITLSTEIACTNQTGSKKKYIGQPKRVYTHGAQRVLCVIRQACVLSDVAGSAVVRCRGVV